MRSLASPAPRNFSAFLFETGIWLFLFCYAVGVVRAAGAPTPQAELFAFVGIVVAFAHAIFVYSWREALAFLALCLAITFTIENISIATGFPFGHYHFEVAPTLPHVGAVPIIVGPLYFAMGHFSWVIASILLGEAEPWPRRPFMRIALPIVAAFVMVQWDVVMDPPNATLGHAWIWHDGGGYFGVPLSNFLGWYLTVWLFFQAFAVLPRNIHGTRRGSTAACVRLVRFVPILLYFSAAISLIAPYFTDPSINVEVAGTHWNARDLHETTVVVALFTMIFTSVLALLRSIEPIAKAEA
jgi:uncharacterized membrane protein